MRYFKAIQNDDNGNIIKKGRYIGNSLLQAAKKAFTVLSKKYKKDMNHNMENNLTFAIQECTRGSKKEIYTYKGNIKKLDNPIEIKIAKGAECSKTITYNYKSTIKPIKQELYNVLFNNKLLNDPNNMLYNPDIEDNDIENI